MTPAEIRAALEQAAKRITFTHSGHRYRVDRTPAPGVTTICKMLYRPQLEAWKIRMQARGTAKACVEFPIQAGEDVELYADRMLKEAVKLLEGERIAKEAADVGNELHSLIEWWCRAQLHPDTHEDLRELEALRPTVSDQAEALFDQWLHWAKDAALEVIAVEQPVINPGPFPRYAGTLDLLANIEARLTVLDWKSKEFAGALYPDQRMQNIAYRQAVAWTLGLTTYPAGMIVVVPRDGSPVRPIPVDSDPAEDWAAFEACARLYEWSKKRG